jgi:hypothetical protein
MFKKMSKTSNGLLKIIIVVESDQRWVIFSNYYLRSNRNYNYLIVIIITSILNAF